MTEPHISSRVSLAIECVAGKAPGTVIFRFIGPFTARAVFASQSPEAFDKIFALESTVVHRRAHRRSHLRSHRRALHGLRRPRHGCPSLRPLPQQWRSFRRRRSNSPRPRTLQSHQSGHRATPDRNRGASRRPLRRPSTPTPHRKKLVVLDWPHTNIGLTQGLLIVLQCVLEWQRLPYKSRMELSGGKPCLLGM